MLDSGGGLGGLVFQEPCEHHASLLAFHETTKRDDVRLMCGERRVSIPVAATVEQVQLRLHETEQGLPRDKVGPERVGTSSHHPILATKHGVGCRHKCVQVEEQRVAPPVAARCQGLYRLVEHGAGDLLPVRHPGERHAEGSEGVSHPPGRTSRRRPGKGCPEVIRRASGMIVVVVGQVARPRCGSPVCVGLSFRHLPEVAGQVMHLDAEGRIARNGRGPRAGAKRDGYLRVLCPERFDPVEQVLHGFLHEPFGCATKPSEGQVVIQHPDGHRPSAIAWVRQPENARAQVLV
ncbi:hypothetical protein D7Y13_00940 [Corallococcus praedator]|uniref:Uncharacterized protein n=1 Tax=Corallococcus praedator TaxID=2316724 RepID=A0ABX9QRZ1_9BACT|nr:hypothetical protein D7X75_05690 [Corallococcus sp. CA031C]RKI17309.1 hypothetical protein D7Y13_00940 [Corallococcus praedator]